MLAVELITWWYGTGIKRLLTVIGSTIRSIALTLSVKILIQTLFAPWRRIVSYGGRSLQDKLRAVLDNLISRLVGGAVRLVVLFVACMGIAVTMIVGGVLLVLWPILPFLAVALIVWGLV